MSYTLINQISSKPLNCNVGYTNSWLEVENDANRDLFAQATYVTNLADLPIQLSAADVQIGGVEIKDWDSDLRADVTTSDGLNALRVLSQDLESTIDDVTIGDKNGNHATVVPHLSSLNVTVTNLVDSSNVDAFGRLRVSEPTTLLDAKFLYNKLPLVFDEKLNGSASSTLSAEDAMVVMRTSANGDYAIRQTKYHFNYQPGKSIQAFFTGYVPQEANVTKRIGLFYALSAHPHEPQGGIYFEITGNDITCNTIKTRGTQRTTSISRNNWNVDKFDGSGPSGLTMELSAAQIFVIDYEWLSLGRVRFGFMLNGKTYYAHYINHLNGLDRPYITSPNLPVSYSIKQTGTGSGVMHHICSTVMIEGGEELIGKPLSVNSSLITNIGTANYEPLLAIRLKQGGLDTATVLKSVEVLNTGSAPAIYTVYLNPTIIGGTLTWNDLDNSSIQWADGNTGFTVTGGTVLYQSTVGSALGGSSVGDAFATIGEITKLGASIEDVSDVIVVAGKAVSNTSDLLAIIRLLERA